MDYPDIDIRTKQDIINEIKELAISYTPEWRFDENNPDLGTTLAYIYADMFGHTIRRFNQVPYKQLLGFFDQVGAKLLPSIPARGYVTFGLVNNEVEGSVVKRGTKVLSAADGETGKPIVFETENDVYVSPSQIDEIVMTHGAKDYISTIYSREIDPMLQKFTLFRFERKNEQEHVFYFAQKTLLNITSDTTIIISFESENLRIQGISMEQLMKGNTATFEYSTEYGYLPFCEVQIEESNVILRHTKEMAPFYPVEEEGELNYWIKMTLVQLDKFAEWGITQVAMKSNARKLLPEMIYANEVEASTGYFYPFGEYYAVYNELYVACNEAFTKKGATIQMKFTLGFQELPPQFPIEFPEIRWKPVMKKNNFVEPPKYEITISTVMWEYFNGTGWCRLFRNDQYSTIFYPEKTREEIKVKMEFPCPADMEPVLVNSKFSYYIRARVIKVNNAYKSNATCITPVVDNLYFDYSYSQNKVMADAYVMKNNKEVIKRIQSVGDQETFFPFQGWSNKEYAVYLGFHVPPKEQPIQILFEMGETIPGKMPGLQTSYYAKSGWKAFGIIDETENFRRTGIITLLGCQDIQKVQMFGKECYWICIHDASNQYEKASEIKRYPQIIQIVPNTTQVKAVEKMMPEYFSIEPNEENYTCKLLNKKIYEITVWVDEQKALSRNDLEDIKKQREVEINYTESGQVKEIWVKWDKVEDFSQSQPKDRHYMVDEIEGVLYFSDGLHGAIPTASDTESIRVEYSCGGGECGNLKEGYIQQLSSSQGFINRVYNPLMTTGGCNQETLEQAVRRSARALKHGNRGVMPKDYEALAMEANRNIIKAKCFANMTPDGKEEYGNVTLVILDRDYEQASNVFEGIREKVLNYMKPFLQGSLLEMNHFHIIQPTLLKLNIEVSLSVFDFNQVLEVKEKVLQRLYEFCHPITGNFDHHGFKIGMLPNITQIMNAVKAVQGVRFIYEVRANAYKRGKNEWNEVNLKQEEGSCFNVAMSGTHQVNIRVEH